MRQDVKELIDSAEEDFALSVNAFRWGYFRASCFHAQQAIEKLLKAYLLLKTNRYPFIHDITELIRNCMSIDGEFEYLLEIKADKLDKYYVGTRYPPILSVSKEEAEEAVDIARKAREFIIRKIGIL